MRVSYQLRTAAAGVPAVWPPRPRVLYFDIDGTLVRPTFGRAKHALAGGRFERILHRAGFDRVVCVSDAVTIARLLAEVAPRRLRADVPSTLFRFCAGVFDDRAWFREHVRAIQDPIERASEFDLREDWYYVDDHAWRYLARAGIPPDDAAERVLQCDPHGEGEDVAAWLTGLAAGRLLPEERRDMRAAPRYGLGDYGLDGSLAPYSWRRE